MFKCCVDYCYYNRKMAVSRVYWTAMSTPTDVALTSLTLCKKCCRFATSGALRACF